MVEWPKIRKPLALFSFIKISELSSFKKFEVRILFILKFIEETIWCNILSFFSIQYIKINGNSIW